MPRVQTTQLQSPLGYRQVQSRSPSLPNPFSPDSETPARGQPPPPPSPIDLGRSEVGSYSIAESDLDGGKSPTMDDQDFLESPVEDRRNPRQHLHHHHHQQYYQDDEEEEEAPEEEEYLEEDESPHRRRSRGSRVPQPNPAWATRQFGQSLLHIGDIMGELAVELHAREDRRDRRRARKKAAAAARTKTPASTFSDPSTGGNDYDSELNDELLRGQWQSMLREQAAASILPAPSPPIRMPLPEIPEIRMTYSPIATPGIQNVPLYESRPRRRAMSRDPSTSAISYVTPSDQRRSQASQISQIDEY